ncbi:MAG: caspase family protein [Stigonema ocellatum SAG 48.90 = DSM 106950]|nr:caspase family protein [Stigonema ocellatum SAG 48.90 = DSM 106950]
MVRNLYGLLVGINHYADPNLDLQGCINDITEIEEYLNNRLDRNQYQLHLRTLKDQQATRDAVVEGIKVARLTPAATRRL